LLEIFAGTDRVTQSSHKQGLECFPIDCCLFPSHNVLNPDIAHSILNFIAGGRIKLIWLGMPCTTSWIYLLGQDGVRKPISDVLTPNGRTLPW